MRGYPSGKGTGRNPAIRGFESLSTLQTFSRSSAEERSPYKRNSGVRLTAGGPKKGKVMETHKITPTGEKEIEVSVGKFRLTNALRIAPFDPGAEYIPACEELAIEARNDDGSYCVIAFVEWDNEEEITEMRTVGERVLDVVESDLEWHQFYVLYDMAAHFIEAKNREREDY